MLQRAEQTEKELFALLRDWGDALTALQLDVPGRPEFDGGIMCPCCKMIHGRSHEAVYPLLALAEMTGDGKYLAAAKKLFRWGENMLCPDGSLRNDAKSAWCGITVFGAVALHDALYYHGSLLADGERRAWETRLYTMGEWLFSELRPDRLKAHINYYAANACAMALLGRYFRRDRYTALARRLAEYCLARTTENGLIYGEGSHDKETAGTECAALDAGGYNTEVTLPSLSRCAAVLGDGEMLSRCVTLWKAHLPWMLPDGAWDGSAGSRAFKWAYWGSRTADGCQEALFALGRRDPVFAEAALRNAELYRRCTHGGLLYGGPELYENGESACVHHTVCRAKTLAGALNGELYDFERAALPSETAPPITHYKELDVFRISFGGWLADVSAYGLAFKPGGHASGGVMTFLSHEKTGPLIACASVTDKLLEPDNQQLPTDPLTKKSPCPRLEAVIDGVHYSQYNCLGAHMNAREFADAAAVNVHTGISDEKGRRFRGFALFRYRFAKDRLEIRGELFSELRGKARFVLPLIGGKVSPEVTAGTLCGETRGFFNIDPGFGGTEYVILPDEHGVFEVSLRV